MTDFGQFLFFAIGIGGGLMFLAWVTIDNLKREFRDDDSLSSPVPVSSRDTNHKGDNT